MFGRGLLSRVEELEACSDVQLQIDAENLKMVRQLVKNDAVAEENFQLITEILDKLGTIVQAQQSRIEKLEAAQAPSQVAEDTELLDRPDVQEGVRQGLADETVDFDFDWVDSEQ